MLFKLIYYILTCCFTVVITAFVPQNFVPHTSGSVQEAAVRDLIKRAIGVTFAAQFKVAVNKSLPFRTYEIKSEEDSDHVTISGWDGVSIAKGFHHILKYEMNRDVSWINTTLDASWVSYGYRRSTSASPIIYYQNVCTWSYSFVWWSWSIWRQHIDWMAMMGISMTIAPIQEDIWFKVYKQIGLTDNEINEHFAGPAFQTWQRMGNIRGWGGPPSAQYRRMQMFLQQQIINAQRELGMIVALPAFAGHVPVAIKRIYPNATFTIVDRWNNFPNKYCCSLFVDPNQTLFEQIARTFLTATINKYGSDHIYFCDPFNELQPARSDAEYLKVVALNIYQSIVNVDLKAVWLLQGWMFVKNPFWTDELIKSFLTAVPRGNLLVLDLQSEQFPQYNRTHSYYGQPFIWCMLHNFGGTLGMYGSATLVNNGINEARHIDNSSMIGVGIAPEGIHQNYVMYSFVLERAWETNNINLDRWIKDYSRARFGVVNEQLERAWGLLFSSVYEYNGKRKLRGKFTITRRPSTILQPWLWYNASNVLTAWTLMLQANSSIPNGVSTDHFELDLVDITRQYLQLQADDLYVNLLSAYKKRQQDRMIYISKKLILIFDDLESILNTKEQFMLGTWLESAKSAASNDVERQFFEINARNQVTTWGPDGQILDYACKQWAGLVRDYYKPRWLLFIELLQQTLEYNRRFNNTEFKLMVSREIENPFSVQTITYPTHPEGHTLTISGEIHNRWTKLIQENDFMHKVRLHIPVYT